MKRKIYLLALFLCFFLQSIFSQIEVKSFRLLENDLAANTHATMVKDKNGEVAALIKVVTTERGFTFEAGMSGIVKVKQEAGEIWVYVPSPLSRITIRHPQYGVLRDYYFDIPIEKARTYEMVLFTPKEEPVQSRVVNRQLLVFEVTPPFATVELDGELLKVSEEGRAERDALFGKRSYRVFAPDYHTVEGEVELNDPVNTHVVKVDLMPQFGWLQIPETDSLAKAKIYINQKNMGTVPFRSEAMQSGIYHLKIKKPHYKVYREKVEVKDNQTIEFRPQLQRRFTATMLMPQVVFTQNLDSSNPNVTFSMKRQYPQKYQFYLQPTIQCGAQMGLGAAMGLYLANVNVEGTYLFGKESDAIYWNYIGAVSNYYRPEKETFTPATISVNAGYGFIIGNRCRITPRVGVNIINFYGQNNNCSALTTSIGARVEYAIINHLGVYLTPEYAIPMYRSDNFVRISQTLTQLNDYVGGFNLKVGCYLYL